MNTRIKLSQKNASITLYIVVLFVVFMAFASFVVDGSLTFNSRLKLQNITETTALAAASEFNYSQNATSSEIEGKVYNKAKELFDILTKDDLAAINNIKIKVDVSQKTVSLNTSAVAKPYFLTFLGIQGININAKASAKSENLPVNALYSGINWLSVNSAYLSDILSKGSNMHDTAILFPLGNFKSASFQYGFINFSLIDSSDEKPLSLGPGGFITIKLPVPIVDKTGNDLYIEEYGSKEGYLVFAGIDNNPDNPYTQSNDSGGDSSEGISWVNISNCGESKEISDNVIFSSSAGNKFYGSGYFDISKAGLSIVKYIRIVDDNEETAFVECDDRYYKTTLYGEASNATAGADIDCVEVLNHVKLIEPIKF